jgi:cobalt-zinc-cadmium efflux system protein
MTDRHDDGHTHAAGADADSRYLAVALALIVGFMVVEVAVAIVSGSLALLSDAGHMLTDAAAIASSLVAIRLAARPSSIRWTFGFKRAEILSAAVNGVTLLVISAVVAVEAIRRLITSPPVEGGPVLAVALLGVAVNLVAVWVLAKANRTRLNVEGSFQHILTDLYGFIATVIAGIVILLTGFARADAIASLIVVVLMLHAAWGLLKDSGRILLEGTPEYIDLAAIRGHLLQAARARCPRPARVDGHLGPARDLSPRHLER